MSHIDDIIAENRRRESSSRVEFMANLLPHQLGGGMIVPQVTLTSNRVTIDEGQPDTHVGNQNPLVRIGNAVADISERWAVFRFARTLRSVGLILFDPGFGFTRSIVDDAGLATSRVSFGVGLITEPFDISAITWNNRPDSDQFIDRLSLQVRNAGLFSNEYPNGIFHVSRFEFPRSGTFYGAYLFPSFITTMVDDLQAQGNPIRCIVTTGAG